MRVDSFPADSHSSFFLALLHEGKMPTSYQIKIQIQKAPPASVFGTMFSFDNQ
jgi:hypothetical protein